MEVCFSIWGRLVAVLGFVYSLFLEVCNFAVLSDKSLEEFGMVQWLRWKWFYLQLELSKGLGYMLGLHLFLGIFCGFCGNFRALGVQRDSSPPTLYFASVAVC